MPPGFDHLSIHWREGRQWVGPVEQLLPRGRGRPDPNPAVLIQKKPVGQTWRGLSVRFTPSSQQTFPCLGLTLDL